LLLAKTAAVNIVDMMQAAITAQWIRRNMAAQLGISGKMGACKSLQLPLRRGAAENHFISVRQRCTARGSLDRLPHISVVIEPREQIHRGRYASAIRHAANFR